GQEFLASFLVICPDARLRDPGQGLAVARKVVGRAPKAFAFWRILGLAHYRLGQWKDAVKALEKAVELQGEGTALDWFPLSMACWQAGDRARARKLYDQATAWVEKHRPADPLLNSLRAEARALVGAEKAAPEKKEKCEQ